MPIYLNGGTFILKHLNSTDSLSKLSKIIFSADTLWQITSFNTEQGIFSVERGSTFMSEQLNDLSSMILYQNTFDLYNMRQKGYVIGLENVGNWAWWKIPIKDTKTGLYTMVGVIYYHIVPEALHILVSKNTMLHLIFSRFIRKIWWVEASSNSQIKFVMGIYQGSQSLNGTRHT